MERTRTASCRRREVAGYLAGYAESFDAPVRRRDHGAFVRRHRGRYLVGTDAGSWAADAVVIATGFCDEPAVPAAAAGLDPTSIR